MADRTSAGIFSEVFEFLAGTSKLSKEEMVKKFWEDARYYDFSTCQMDCDESLVKLGLAVECKCGGMVYKGETADYHDEPECNPEDWKDFARKD